MWSKGCFAMMWSVELFVQELKGSDTSSYGGRPGNETRIGLRSPSLLLWVSLHKEGVVWGLGAAAGLTKLVLMLCCFQDREGGFLQHFRTTSFAIRMFVSSCSGRSLNQIDRFSIWPTCCSVHSCSFCSLFKLSEMRAGCVVEKIVNQWANFTVRSQRHLLPFALTATKYGVSCFEACQSCVVFFNVEYQC